MSQGLFTEVNPFPCPNPLAILARAYHLFKVVVR